MKVSIIMPIYNSENYLNECLKSIRYQDYDNFEVLMINDGSTDNSEKICKFYAENDKRFLYFYKKNSGVSDTRNYGLKKATGEYVCFVDSDDIVSKNYLLDFIKLIDKGSKSLICCDLSNRINKIDNTCFSNHKITEYKNNDKYNVMFDACSCFMCNRIFDLNIIKKNNIYFNVNITMCEDLLFNLKYLKFVNNVKYLQKNNYYYRIRKSSLSKSLENKKWFSIVDALLEMISIYNLFNQYVKKKSIYFCNSVILEYEYRSKFVKMDYSTKINKLKKIIESKEEEIYFKDKLKTIIFKLFPKIVMNYKLNK